MISQKHFTKLKYEELFNSVLFLLKKEKFCTRLLNLNMSQQLLQALRHLAGVVITQIF